MTLNPKLNLYLATVYIFSCINVAIAQNAPVAVTPLVSELQLLLGHS